ncbi:putative F-box/kelch-repeat protein-like [Capsicum annuum]|nr:putative F-box/kelch-repeat protein-like [Capsicum annuum]KAF3657302.1 putative F-box/kelch-repeat protein-like [Capsicum annuum]
MLAEYMWFRTHPCVFSAPYVQMVRSHTSQDGGQEPPPAPEPIARDKIHKWGKRRGRGRGRGRERCRGAAQISDSVGSLGVEFEAGGDDVQVPADDAGLGQAPPGFVATPILQDTLIKVLGVVETITQGGGSFGVGATGGIRAGMSDEEQRRFEKLRKMDPPQFQGDQREDAHEFLVSCHERLQSVGLVDSHGLIILPYRCVVPPSSSGAPILIPANGFSTDDLGDVCTSFP